MYRMQLVHIYTINVTLKKMAENLLGVYVQLKHHVRNEYDEKALVTC